MPVFRPGSRPVITALEPSVVMALGGEPLAPRFIDWNFVSSRKDRIEQAKAGWRAGRIKLPEHDDREFMPLPPEPGAPPTPMSSDRAGPGGRPAAAAHLPHLPRRPPPQVLLDPCDAFPRILAASFQPLGHFLDVELLRALQPRELRPGNRHRHRRPVPRPERVRGHGG